MRKILSLLFVFSITVFQFSNAQISLVNTIETSSYKWSKFTNNDGSTGYVHPTSVANVLKVYNSDFSLNRTITLNVANLVRVIRTDKYNGYDLTIYGSTHLFNTDDKLEFVVTMKDPNTNIYSFAVVNENSNVLFTKSASDTSISGFYFSIAATSNAYLLVGYESTIEKTEVYSLPGSERFDYKTTGVSNVASAVNQEISYAYPNPSKVEVNLAYSIPTGEIGELKIFDLNGKCLRSMKVDGIMPYVKVDVSKLPSSTYVYEIQCKGNTVSNKFTVSN